MSETLPCCDIPAASHPHCCLCRCYHHEPARYDKEICAGCDALLAARGLRRCKACGVRRPLHQFELMQSGGRRRVCGSCRGKQGRARPGHHATRRARYQQRKDELAAYMRAWRKAHPGANTKYIAAYRQRHPDRTRAQKRRWYQSLPLEKRADRIARNIVQQRARRLDKKLSILRQWRAAR